MLLKRAILTLSLQSPIPQSALTIPAKSWQPALFAKGSPASQHWVAGAFQYSSYLPPSHKPPLTSVQHLSTSTSANQQPLGSKEHFRGAVTAK
ncbi:hypothetical protein PGT21_018168 [Puccinia graminis f. sp. tritici]|uniref:Uncharacterized protein n=1 Tax=Puccinia graminis f. sp. tritici TaxID=56615 RepID=A0A5B0P9M3_PUCGR|nr:hypothetical protein PGT21_018168 [Puccinia graminis f. sp. tritici]KAA1126049.1 hypothetical protein PGTUg99_017559 [Puccinia graminis f. sp. tritici]